MKPTTSRWLRFGLGALIWAGLIAALVTGWESAQQQLVSSAPLVAVAVPMIVVGLVGGAKGWATLQPLEIHRRALRAFLAAQPAKYLPGGAAFQFLGQIGMTSATRSDRSRVGVSFVVHALVQMVSASSVAAFLLVAPPENSGWLPMVVMALAIALPLALRTSVIQAGVGLLQRMLRSIDLTGSPPATKALWGSWAWTLLPLLFSGTAFALLAGQATSFLVIVATVGAFSAAWLAGFVAFPLPSGLGVREIVLVQLLPAMSPAQVIATSVLHRFSTLLAELLVLIVVSRRAFAAPDPP